MSARQPFQPFPRQDSVQVQSPSRGEAPGSPSASNMRDGLNTSFSRALSSTPKPEAHLQHQMKTTSTPLKTQDFAFAHPNQQQQNLNSNSKPLNLAGLRRTRNPQSQSENSSRTRELEGLLQTKSAPRESFPGVQRPLLPPPSSQLQRRPARMLPPPMSRELSPQRASPASRHASVAPYSQEDAHANVLKQDLPTPAVDPSMSLVQSQQTFDGYNSSPTRQVYEDEPIHAQYRGLRRDRSEFDELEQEYEHLHQQRQKRYKTAEPEASARAEPHSAHDEIEHATTTPGPLSALARALEVAAHDQEGKDDDAENRWADCTMEEWQAGAEELAGVFGQILTRVTRSMAAQMKLTNDLHAVVAARKARIEARDAELSAARAGVVKRARMLRDE